MKRSVRIVNLSFTGREGQLSELIFPAPISFIYGASNTGKSFAVKSLDFMFGGNRELPLIGERRPYSGVKMSLELHGENVITLERGIAGGDFKLHQADGIESILGARHTAGRDDNLSSYLLQVIGAPNKEVAKDKSGTKKSLSFRDIVRFCITDEAAIQAERSPVESGDLMFAPLERNVFKFLLTGEDDAPLITQIKPRDFKTGRSAQIRIIENLIAEIESELIDNFPDRDQLDELKVAIDDSLAQIEADIVAARKSIGALLEQKRVLVRELNSDQQRVTDMSLSLESFDQLQSVYKSDVARLEAIEEAGFLLGLDSSKSCPVCGAPPEAQKHDHGLADIEKARVAAEIEIAKIKVQQAELQATIGLTSRELDATGDRVVKSRGRLAEIETELLEVSPNALEQQRRFSEIIPRRDRVNQGLELVRRLEHLQRQKTSLEKMKNTRPKTNFQPGLSTFVAQEFADEVAKVLTAWDFPGNRRVVFDAESYDLIIDGKHRRNNGKGVRAITHAAFKVALLTFCVGRGLPHPGFLILDSPLITYRDPIRSSAGALTPDEEAIKRTDLKDRMFEHLGSLGENAQWIVFDNADPPSPIPPGLYVESFTNDPAQGRQGLL